MSMGEAYEEAMASKSQAGPGPGLSQPARVCPWLAGRVLTLRLLLTLTPRQPGSGSHCTDRTRNYVLISF